jgi:hypothetical protein
MRLVIAAAATALVVVGVPFAVVRFRRHFFQ